MTKTEMEVRVSMAVDQLRRVLNSDGPIPGGRMKLLDVIHAAEGVQEALWVESGRVEAEGESAAPSVWDRYSTGEIGLLFGFVSQLAEAVNDVDDDDNLEIRSAFGVSRLVRVGVARGAIGTIQRLWNEAAPEPPTS